MDVDLRIESEDLSAETAQALLRNLCRDLNREAGVGATLAEGPPKPGARGVITPELLTIPQWVLGGGAVGMGAVGMALMDVFKSYFERNPRFRLKFRRADGKELTLSQESLTPDHVSRTADQVVDLLAGRG